VCPRAISTNAFKHASRRSAVSIWRSRRATPPANRPLRVMFVPDTNILPAMMSAKPVREVAAWVSGQPAETLFTAAVCQAEILAGLAIMPEGRRRLDLEAAARAMFDEDFAGRVLPFDTGAAVACADIFAARRRAGRPTATVDLMIASIALSQGASVVTRNVVDFEECGAAIVNPWAY
jgi:toxin FitB